MLTFTPNVVKAIKGFAQPLFALFFSFAFVKEVFYITTVQNPIFHF